MVVYVIHGYQSDLSKNKNILPNLYNLLQCCHLHVLDSTQAYTSIQLQSDEWLCFLVSRWIFSLTVRNGVDNIVQGYDQIKSDWMNAATKRTAYPVATAYLTGNHYPHFRSPDSKLKMLQEEM